MTMYERWLVDKLHYTRDVMQRGCPATLQLLSNEQSVNSHQILTVLLETWPQMQAANALVDRFNTLRTPLYIMPGHALV